MKCPECETEGCEYMEEYGEEMCCHCDNSTDPDKYCSNCMSDYISNIADWADKPGER